MSINCLAIDDEPLALDVIEEYVNKVPFLNLIGKFTDPVEATAELHKGSIDLIFLDTRGNVAKMYQMQPGPNTPDDQLQSYGSGRWPIQFAIELAGGTIDTLDLKVHQRIELPTEDLKRWAR